MSLSRRQFVASSLALPALAAPKKVQGPGIVLVLVDNLPTWVLGCYGGKEVNTPNINHLAQTGVRLVNHVTAAPAAAQNRASLLSGLTSLQLKGGAAIPEAEVTIAKLLSGTGYACHSAEGAAADVVAQSTKFLAGQTADKPFFLEAWIRDLAPPYDGVAKKYRDMYATARFESCFPSPPPAPNARAGKEMLANLLPSLRLAAAAISSLDDQVGALAAALQQRQMLDGSLIIFASTCGSLYGRHGLWNSGAASDPVNMFEEVVAPPMIWRWPMRMPPQTIRPEWMGACDLLPTVCEIAGATPPKRNFSGRSYYQLLLGRTLPKKQAWRSVKFSHMDDTDMVRDTRYKLVLRGGGKGPNEFYDLNTDPREARNGYEDGQFASIRPGLAEEIAKWRQAYSA
jgi:arylsulfatase A-like enzyme